jgi:hypothetical protein
MADDLFRFEWPVDQDGYEIWRNPHSEDLARELRRSETVFIRPRGGPLRYYRPLEIEGLWLRFAETCKTIEGALAFANEFGCILALQSEFPEDIDEIDFYLSAANTLRQISKFLSTGDKQSAAELFNASSPIVIEKVHYNERAARFDPIIVPTSLLSAMDHQALQAITGDQHFRRCRNEACSNWFRVGARAHTARRAFCSDRCRVASARRQKREAVAHA